MVYPPFSTAMERALVMRDVRIGTLPSEKEWRLRAEHPAIAELIASMLRRKPADRPNAADIVNVIERLLGKGANLTLGDESGVRARRGAQVILRVDADKEDLPTVLAAINDACRQSGGGGGTVEQYGLRGSANGAIMEFLLDGETCVETVVAAVEALPGVSSCEHTRIVR